MTDEIEAALEFYQSQDDVAAKLLAGFRETPDTVDENSRARKALTLYRKQQEELDGLRTWKAAHENTADIKGALIKRSVKAMADIEADSDARTAELLAVIADLMDNYDPESQAIAVDPDAGCLECTAGTTPHFLDHGPCAYHRAHRLIKQAHERSKT